MNADLLKRRQRAQCSCGAAVLTVALAELGAEPNTDETEEKLWRSVRGCDETWSVPGKLANTARREYGIRTGIWQDNRHLQANRSIIPKERITFDVESHLKEHESALAHAEANGVIVTRERHDVGTLATLMDQGWRLLLVIVVPVTPNVNLHYILGRRR